MNRERPHYHIWDKYLKRGGKDIIVYAQLFIMAERKKIRFLNQGDWDNYTEAYELLEKCLRKLEGR